jgi:hypothetical protein
MWMALKETIRIMAEIDKAIPAWPITQDRDSHAFPTGMAQNDKGWKNEERGF